MVIIALFIVVIALSAVAYGLHRRVMVETIDPGKVFNDPLLPTGTAGEPAGRHD